MNKIEISRIEALQDRVSSTRAKAAKIMFKMGFKDIGFSISNGEKLTKTEADTVFRVAKVVKPIPIKKAKFVYFALINSFNYRSFNQFGQELK